LSAAPIRFLAGSLPATVVAVIALSAAAILAAVTLFGLTAGGAVALYFVVWWISLFAVLPFGIRSQIEAGEVTAGTDPGAPAAPALREKALWTTLVAAAVLVAMAAAMPLSGL
jgi:predicted secreted protein